MKTIALRKNHGESAVTVEFTDTELTVLVALVEEGRKRLLQGGDSMHLHQRLDALAEEFCSLLGHLELLTPHD